MDAAAPHVVLLPFPAQGHIKPMLHLADLLAGAHFRVSFVTTEHSTSRIVDHDRRSTIDFYSIPDGLAPDHSRSGFAITDLFFSIPAFSKAKFRDIVASLRDPPVTCVISDGIMSFAIDVAEELGIPAITFRTFSATSTWTYFHLQRLIEDGEIPVREGTDQDFDRLVSCIPGLETMKRRSLPSICRLEPDNQILQFFIDQAAKMAKASALILNTFEELEAPMISQLHSIFPTIYAVGPLHSAAKNSSAAASLMPVDESCMEWLESQAPKSVLYVSLGTIAELSRAQVLEIWNGLVNSAKPFLWALRPDSVLDPGGVLDEIKMGTRDMGHIVSWAPQEDVLAHRAVGGFLTHSGWNSTLESIWAGQPMICLPRIAEQKVNSMCVSEMWRIGMDMKDSCDRATVEAMARDLMERRREELVKSVTEIAGSARDSVRPGGSSRRNAEKLVQDMRLIHSKNKISF